jgi:hypothetical protein
MASRTSQEAGGSVKSVRLEALLDKLVAVRMDLEPVCSVSGEGAPPVVVTSDAIAGACTVLHSAIADLRNIIYQVDGSTDLPGAAS